MKEWKLSEAKARFSEVVSRVKEEPQVILNRNHKAAVLIDVDAWEDYEAWKRSSGKPGLRDLLDELQQIYREEPAEFVAPPREERPPPDLGE